MNLISDACILLMKLPKFSLFCGMLRAMDLICPPYPYNCRCESVCAAFFVGNRKTPVRACRTYI